MRHIFWYVFWYDISWRNSPHCILLWVNFFLGCAMEEEGFAMSWWWLMAKTKSRRQTYFLLALVFLPVTISSPATVPPEHARQATTLEHFLWIFSWPEILSSDTLISSFTSLKSVQTSSSQRGYTAPILTSLMPPIAYTAISFFHSI